MVTNIENKDKKIIMLENIIDLVDCTKEKYNTIKGFNTVRGHFYAITKNNKLTTYFCNQFLVYKENTITKTELIESVLLYAEKIKQKSL